MAACEVIRDKNGKIVKYKFRCCVGRDEHYKQIWRSKTIKRPEGLTPKKEEKEVQRMMDAWEDRVKQDFERNHGKVENDKISFEDFVDNHWMKDHVLDGRHTPSTVSFFHVTSAPTVEYFGTKKLSAINAESIKRYINYLRNEHRQKNGKPYSETTISHCFSTLRNIMEYAVRMGYISEDPCQGLTTHERPHAEKQKVDFLSVDEAKAFLSALESEPLFWRCFATLLIMTGLRRGEAVGLQWGDIDREKLKIKVVRNITMDKNAPNKIHVGKTKTGTERTLYVPAELCEMLCQLRAEREAAIGTELREDAYVFCRGSDPYMPINPTEPTRWQKRFTDRNGFRSVSPHDLRHTAATLAIQSGADVKDVQALLGHKDPAMTLAFYVGYNDENERRVARGIYNTLFDKNKD